MPTSLAMALSPAAHPDTLEAMATSIVLACFDPVELQCIRAVSAGWMREVPVRYACRRLEHYVQFAVHNRIVEEFDPLWSLVFYAERGMTDIVADLATVMQARDPHRVAHPGARSCLIFELPTLIYSTYDKYADDGSPLLDFVHGLVCTCGRNPEGVRRSKRHKTPIPPKQTCKLDDLCVQWGFWSKGEIRPCVRALLQNQPMYDRDFEPYQLDDIALSIVAYGIKHKHPHMIKWLADETQREPISSYTPCSTTSAVMYDPAAWEPRFVERFHVNEIVHFDGYRVAKMIQGASYSECGQMTYTHYYAIMGESDAMLEYANTLGFERPVLLRSLSFCFRDLHKFHWYRFKPQRARICALINKLALEISKTGRATVNLVANSATRVYFDVCEALLPLDIVLHSGQEFWARDKWHPAQYAVYVASMKAHRVVE